MANVKYFLIPEAPSISADSNTSCGSAAKKFFRRKILKGDASCGRMIPQSEPVSPILCTSTYWGISVSTPGIIMMARIAMNSASRPLKRKRVKP